MSGANIAAAQADGFQARNGPLTRRKTPAATPPNARIVRRTSVRCRCQYHRNRNGARSHGVCLNAHAIPYQSPARAGRPRSVAMSNAGTTQRMSGTPHGVYWTSSRVITRPIGATPRNAGGARRYKTASPARWNARYTTRTSVIPATRIGTYTRNESGGYGEVPNSPPLSKGDQASAGTWNALRDGSMLSAYGLRPCRSSAAE